MQHFPSLLLGFLLAAALFFILGQRKSGNLSEKKRIPSEDASAQGTNLPEEEELSCIMMDATPLGVTSWTSDFRNTNCNLAAVKLFGLASKEECMERFFDLSPKYQPSGRLSKDMIHEWLSKAFAEGYERFEWVHCNLKGEAIPCEITLVRLLHLGNTMVLAFIRDMREFRTMLAEMHKVEDDLRQAWSDAEESNKAKSQFLATVSHEIRTPMNVILGITEMQLQEEGLSPDVHEAFSKIRSSGDLLLHIIHDILDLSKIDAGKLELVLAKFDVGSLINDSINFSKMRSEQKPIEFQLEVDENVPADLYGDELRIKQILNNILSNAFKYTQEGEVKLTVSSETVPGEDKTNLILVISDTGQGMSPEQIHRLFDEYIRFNAEANRTTVGTGLGMTITRNLVSLMGGTIEVKSEVGKGSTFTVRLPLAFSGAKVIGREAAEHLGQFNATSTLSKREPLIRVPMPYGHVLLVDDMVTNIDVAKIMLKPYGLKIETALSGFEALQLVEDGAVYDIIFMDHMMPKMDGMEATRKLREMGYNQPIVALTANAVVGQAEIFLQNGFDAFISKPIDIRQLNEVLNRLIR
ncbi:MAG: ATP-binding protein, partial [Symbiobacteriaceae bacterium]|nr:ATP-binding protein [Symbiobacteriaceae bacterium]